MIEATMYIVIGFLLGALVSLFFVPTVHNRAVRLAEKQLARDVPESLVELAAAKDLVRAEFALATRQMELKSERLWRKSIDDARQLAKKDKRIDRLEIEISALKVRLAREERRLWHGNEAPLVPGEARLMGAIEPTSNAMLDFAIGGDHEGVS
jgi:hypothetical protein